MGKRRLEDAEVFAEVRIPVSCRGNFVLIADGRVIATSRDPQALISQAAALDIPPLLFGVPEDDEAVKAAG